MSILIRSYLLIIFMSIKLVVSHHILSSNSNSNAKSSSLNPFTLMTILFHSNMQTIFTFPAPYYNADKIISFTVLFTHPFQYLVRITTIGFSGDNPSASSCPSFFLDFPSNECLESRARWMSLVMQKKMEWRENFSENQKDQPSKLTKCWGREKMKK